LIKHNIFGKVPLRWRRIGFKSCRDGEITQR
jgi:hypothetical protein